VNSREQILAKRVAALEARLQASMVVIDHLIKDLEFTESVGAAFAWDLGVYASEFDVADLSADWDKAVAALEAERAK
jgi:hypothetical protein